MKEFNLKKFFKAILAVVKISYFYILYRRLYFDNKYEVIIQLDFSKPPDKKSYIQLNTSRRDKY